MEKCRHDQSQYFIILAVLRPNAHELAGPHLYVIARVGNPVSDLNLGPPALEKNALPLDQQLSFC